MNILDGNWWRLLFKKKRKPSKPRTRPQYGSCLTCQRVIAINKKGEAYPHKVIKGGKRCPADHGFDFGCNVEYEVKSSIDQSLGEEYGSHFKI